METYKIFEKTGSLGNEIKRLQNELEIINLQCLHMMKICPHEIVFKYVDNYPKKLVIDGTYFCPACGKTIQCIQEKELENTSFKNSRIVPLTNLSLLRSGKLYYTIRNEVYKNFDLYYDLDTPVEELSSKMEEVLKNQEQRYNSPVRVLRKTKKNI